MLTVKNHYTAQGWMVTELGLTGNELTVFAILWGFSQDGSTGSRTPLQYFMDWLGCSKPTIIDIMRNLEQKGLITAERNEGQVTYYQPVKNLNQCKNLTTPVKKFNHPGKEILPATINNNNININAQYARANELFDLWWTIYKGRSGRGGCLSYWHNLTEEEMQQVIEHSKRYIEKAVAPLHPYAYLVTYQYWRNETPKREYDEQPKPEEKPSMTGKVLVRIDGELQTVEKKYAEENGLYILADYEK